MNIFENLKSELSEFSKDLLKTNSGSRENLYQSNQTYISQTLYLRQIIYSSIATSNKFFDIFKYFDQNI